MDLSTFVHLKPSLESEGRVLVIEIDHGKANEMGRDQVAELDRLVRSLVEATEVVAMITWSRRVSSKGTPIFVAGANVTERVGWPSDQVRQHVRWQRRVLAALRGAPVFHVGVFDGVALGWGTEYLLACDWRIAGDRAELGLPETGIGILPGAGGTSEMWAQVGVAHALRMGMTGERMSADEAYRIGLVQERVIDVDAGLIRARELAAKVVHRSPTAVAAFKRAVLACVGAPAEVREEIEARAYEHCLDTGEAAFGRANFDRIRGGERPEWAPRVPWRG